jgi:hypothetical protein
MLILGSDYGSADFFDATKLDDSDAQTWRRLCPFLKLIRLAARAMLLHERLAMSSQG